MDVPLDTEPAIAFHPALPGFHVKRGRHETKFKFWQEMNQPNSSRWTIWHSRQSLNLPS